MRYLFCFTATLLINSIFVNCANDSPVSREEFDNLKSTVYYLEKLAESHISLNKRLESVIQRQEVKLKQLENTAVQYKELVQQQELDITRQKDMIRKLEGLISGSTERIKEHEDISKNVVKPVDVQRKYVKDTSRITRYAPNTVAFFTTLGVSSLEHVGVHQNIAFDDVVTNIGNGYNSHSGVFNAPVKGLYLITTSILSRQNMEFWVEVQVNGITIVRMNERGTDGRHGSGSQTLIVSLEKGDDVVIQNSHPDEAYWGNKYSSFGGFLIEELENDESSIVG